MPVAALCCSCASLHLRCSSVAALAWSVALAPKSATLPSANVPKNTKRAIGRRRRSCKACKAYKTIDCQVSWNRPAASGSMATATCAPRLLNVTDLHETHSLPYCTRRTRAYTQRRMHSSVHGHTETLKSTCKTTPTLTASPTKVLGQGDLVAFRPAC